VRSEILEALDVGLDVLSQLTLYANLTEAVLDERDLIGRELMCALERINLGCLQNVLRSNRTNAVDVRQRDADALLIWDVDSEETHEMCE
jgi:hypothetical protein